MKLFQCVGIVGVTAVAMAFAAPALAKNHNNNGVAKGKVSGAAVGAVLPGISAVTGASVGAVSGGVKPKKPKKPKKAR